MSNLVNLGSLCIDYVYSVSTIANPGETVASKNLSVFPGGKGLNQSVAAVKAGARVQHFGAVGVDGEELVQFMQAAGVSVDGVINTAGRSGHAVIQIDEAGQNSIVIAGGANREVSPGVISRALEAVESDGWLLLQNEVNDISFILDSADRLNCSVAMNLAPFDSSALEYNYHLVDLLIVNELEAQGLSGCASVDAAYEHLILAFPDTSLVLTVGKQGLYYYEAEQRMRGRLNAYAVDVVDETAAGDTFVGFLMAGLLTGASLEEILSHASAAGALATTKHGAAPSIPDLEEVYALQTRQPTLSAS
jgi:ribokinase